MRILALDQSSYISGYSIFENGVLIDYGIISCSNKDIGKRLQKIRNTVNNFISEYDIDELILEDIQLQEEISNNVQTFKILAEVFGVLYELATELNLPHREIMSESWRAGLGLKGHTRPQKKKAAQDFIKRAYGLEVTEDEADAICIGTFASFTNKSKIGNKKSITFAEEGHNWAD